MRSAGGSRKHQKPGGHILSQKNQIFILDRGSTGKEVDSVATNIINNG
jgi:hypothetical protein